ncbi:hypothetical protein V5P93_003073 [Actinokineospora auranticolor]|uniref:Uncharacterized protein n=1 Tax=Actinokineospora auranticolor TaxID=155976 RepID=A0A2S6H145_9PSEU|nr:hypothetical protein [Actinokineospora auranticolor]PPK71209.1 hypothetical protein CLV40_101398 [Actinokineospora auranticolor]
MRSILVSRAGRRNGIDVRKDYLTTHLLDLRHARTGESVRGLPK